MALKTAQVPTSFVDPVRRAVRAISPAGAFAHLDVARLHATVPHPVYVLGLDALTQGKGLEAAELVAYRYLLVQDASAVAAAEIPIASASRPNAVAQLNTGDFVAGTRSAIEEAERLHEVQTGDYEVRLLRIPALYVVALWLHRAPSTDIVVPIAPAPAELSAGRSYTGPELTQALAPRATKIASFDSSPRP